MSDQDVQILDTKGWFKQFYNGLLSAFPTQGELKRMVRFELDESLDAIAGGKNHSEVVSNLIEWAESKGRLEELLSAARKDNPGNPALQRFYEQVLKDDLSSDTGVNYTRLRDLLVAGKWKEADEEILAVMLKASGREKYGWLNHEFIENFPYRDLGTIDQLWVKYSSGRFGFSVQKRIWESVGGNPNAPYPIWLNFCDRVGWRVRGKYIELDVAYNTSSCDGHFPIRILEQKFSGHWHLKSQPLIDLFVRIEELESRSQNS